MSILWHTATEETSYRDGINNATEISTMLTIHSESIIAIIHAIIEKFERKDSLDWT